MARLPSQKLAPLKELRCYHATETSCSRIARSKLGNNHHHLALKKNVPQQFEMGNFEGEVQRKKNQNQNFVKEFEKWNFGSAWDAKAKPKNSPLPTIGTNYQYSYYLWTIKLRISRCNCSKTQL